MITFSKLGKYGRLGNQLFQISTVIAHAKRLNLDFGFPDWYYNKYLKQSLNICSTHLTFRTYTERDPWDFSPIPKGGFIDLHGYFQNYLYFNDYKDLIIKMLEPNKEVVDYVSDKFFDFNQSRITAIHVRRGDYLKLPNHHPVPTMDYYNRAIDLLKDETDIFMVFSDDIEWCKQNFKGPIIFSEENDEFVELYKMSRCHNFIIANSSFSWWGSYLSSNNGKVIAPNEWVGIEYRNKKWKGIYRNEMNII